MKIKRESWMDDEDLVSDWLNSDFYDGYGQGIEQQIIILRRNVAKMLLELNKDKVLEVCEDK